MKLWTVAIAMTLALTTLHADAAKRLGGGKSMGQQSSNVTQRDSAPPPAAPAAGTNASNATVPNAAAAKPAAGAAAPAAAPKRPWGAMLGGLAAGLGLAWLASSLGLGEGLAQLMTVVLLVGAVVLLLGWFLRRKASSSPQGGLAYQGAGGGVGGDFSASKPYNPKNVGNDASARPWERNSMAFDAATVAGRSGSGSLIGSALAGSQNWGIPAGFDTEGFLKAAKANFVTLQSAWDKADISTLRSMMTDEMVTEIRSQLAEREHQASGLINQTDVVMLEAHLLGIEEMPDVYMASVEFSGMIREEPASSPNPFREVWNMTKPKAGGGWLVAGVQALQ